MSGLSPAPPAASAAVAPLQVTLTDVCAATGARIVHGDSATLLGALDIDSRRLTPGDWFLAHEGTSSDGHEFLGAARDAGIAGAVVTRPERLPDGWVLPTLAVDDHAAFLEALGKLIRARFTGPVVGVTGSVGKTTCKHVLAHLLAHDRAVLATPWNWNTEIGVPLTLSRLLKEGADVCVLEFAMRGPGQIAQLTDLARPDVGILTAIAPVHLELLGSLWGILEAKLELFAQMAPGGWWVYPAPDAFIRAGIANLPATPHQTIRFAPGIQMVEPGDPDLLMAERFRFDLATGAWEFTLAWREERIATRFASVALGQVWSALAAVAGAIALGVPLAECARRLPLTPAITGRMELRTRFPGRTILFDCYNSNPVSASDALETLARVGQARPTIAVLGGMKELGPEAERYHRELGGTVRALKIDKLLAIGDEAEWIAAGATGAATEVFTAASIAEAGGWLGTQVPGNAVVLLKGSRAYRLEDALELAW